MANEGIMHAAYSRGGQPFCKTRNSHMSTTIDRFRLEPKPCKRCAAKLVKIDALAAKKAERERVAIAKRDTNTVGYY